MTINTAIRANHAGQIFCAECGRGPLKRTVAFDGHIYCADCGMPRMVHNSHFRDCRVYLPESEHWSQPHLLTKITGVHWLRENGQFLGFDGTLLSLSFPPPKGETYVAYVQESHRSGGMWVANALVVSDPGDYYYWAGDFSGDFLRPVKSVIWFKVKKLLLVPFTDYPLF